MAATTEDGLLTSQFFFTLDKATELDKKNTLFGRIVGDTVYNLLRIGELDADPTTERPLYPPKITSIEILLNPFDDIIPREFSEVKARLQAGLQAKLPKTKPTATAIKNRSLLSFEDDEEEASVIETVKIMSSHDILNDPKLSKQIAKLKPIVNAPSISHAQAPKQPSAYERLMQKKDERLKQIEESINAVEKDLKRTHTDGHQREEPEKKPKVDSVCNLLGRKPKVTNASFLQEQLATYKNRPHTIVGRRPKDHVEDVNTLLTLNAFKEKLNQIDETRKRIDPTTLTRTSGPEPAKVLDICKLHGLVNCLSCRDTFGVREDGTTEEGWLMHRLAFDKETGYKEIREELTNLLVIDPREKMTKHKH